MYSFRQSLGKLVSFLGTFTSKDLDAYEAINRQGTNFTPIINTTFANIELSNLKNWYLSKFIYKGDDKINWLLVEEYLWTWGWVAIVQWKGEYLIGSFTPLSWNHNNEVLNFNFLPINQAVKKRNKKYLTNGGHPQKFINGVDGVIMYCGAPYFLNSKNQYTPMIKTISQLNSLANIRDQILIDCQAGKTFLTVPIETSNENVKILIDTILNGDPVIRLNGSLAKSNLRSDGQNDTLELKMRTPELINAYHFIRELIETGIGIATNSMADKREKQIEVEISVNNAKSGGINETELRYRKQGCKLLKKVYNIDVQVSLRSQERLTNGNQRQERTITNQGTGSNQRNTNNQSS